MNTLQDITNPDCWVEYDMSAELEKDQVEYERTHRDQISVSVVPETDPEPTIYCDKCGVGGQQHDPKTDGFDCQKLLSGEEEYDDEQGSVCSCCHEIIDNCVCVGREHEECINCIRKEVE